jgi:hypothetical protein
MNKWIKILLVMAGLGILGGVLGYVFVYNKPHPNYEKKAPEYFISAQDLFDAYRDNQTEAGAKFTGTMVAVEGMLTFMPNGENLIPYFVIDEGFFGPEGIRISMLENHFDALREIAPGSMVTIKGYCSGYNDPDVIIEHGSIIQ